MTTKKTIEALGEVGLTEREQAVYLTLLAIGIGSVLELARRTGLERTGIYPILERLQSLGLVTEQQVGRKRRFVANDPKRLLELLGLRQQAVARVLPELQALWTATDVRPRVRYYEGVDGMRLVLNDTLTTKKAELRGILSAEDLFSTVGMRWIEAYTKRRIVSGLRLRVIRSRQKEVGERWPTSRRDQRILRYAPEAMAFSMTMYVYDNKVALLSTRQENFGMIIESDEFATHQGYLFEALWQVSTPAPERD